MFEAQCADKNARLLLQIKDEQGADGLGSIANFFDVEADWRCPCCLRDKSELARKDKNGNLLCALHRHHDHYVHCIAHQVRKEFLEMPGALPALEGSFVRFQDILICNDCNVAEPYAKNLVGAPEFFSFTPYEIAGFITVTVNAPHEVDPARAEAAFKAAEPSMKLISQRLRALMTMTRSGEGTTFEPAAAAAWRVVNEVRKLRSANE